MATVIFDGEYVFVEKDYFKKLLKAQDFYSRVEKYGLVGDDALKSAMDDVELLFEKPRKGAVKDIDAL